MKRLYSTSIKQVSKQTATGKCAHSITLFDRETRFPKLSQHIPTILDSGDPDPRWPKPSCRQARSPKMICQNWERQAQQLARCDQFAGCLWPAISVSSVDRCQLKMYLHLFQLAWGSSSTGSMAPSSTYKMHQKAIKHDHCESKYLQNTCKALARNQWSRILLVPAPCLTRLTF